MHKALLTLFLVPFLAFGWGKTGHRVVGQIAQNHLTPKAAKAVKDLLGPDSLAAVANWADEIRSDPSWKKADPWHYVNIPDGQTYAAMEKNPAGDVIVAFNKFTDAALNIQILHWWKSTDSRAHMADMQELNFTVKQRLEAAGIEFAFPTQTLHLRTPGEPRAAAATVTGLACVALLVACGQKGALKLPDGDMPQKVEHSTAPGEDATPDRSNEPRKHIH